MSKKTKHLPATFAGARVMRGLAMKDVALRKLEEKAYSEFSDARGKGVYLVIEDKALRDGAFMDPQLFADRKDAIRCARALANGNVDQRVLLVTEQVLVIGTESDL